MSCFRSAPLYQAFFCMLLIILVYINVSNSNTFSNPSITGYYSAGEKENGTGSAPSEHGKGGEHDITNEPSRSHSVDDGENGDHSTQFLLDRCRDQIHEYEEQFAEGGRGICDGTAATKAASSLSSQTSSTASLAAVHIAAPTYEPMLDSWLFPNIPDGVDRRYHEPENWRIAWNMTWTGHEGLFMPKKYGAKFNTINHPSYVHDPIKNIHRLYYRCGGTGMDKVCFAESSDGGLTFHSGRNNIVTVPKDNPKYFNPIVSINANPSAPPAHKYLLLAGHQNVLSWSSPDGKSWTRDPGGAVTTVADEKKSHPTCMRAYYDGPSTAIWDEGKQRYVIFFRTNRAGPSCTRWVAVAYSKTWPSSDWGQHHSIKLNSGELWEESLYAGYPLRVPGNARLRLLLSMRARRSAVVGNRHYAADMTLLASRDPDFVAWSRVSSGPLFSEIPSDTFQNGRITVYRTWPVAGGFVRHTDENGRRMWSFMMQNGACFIDPFAKREGFFCDEHPEKGNIFRAEYVAGRVASIGTDRDVPFPKLATQAPQIKSRPFTTDAKTIAINCVTSAYGSVAYALVAASDGKALPGYGFADSRLIYGSAFEMPLLWKQSSTLPASLATVPVQLVILLSRARVFSLTFSNEIHGKRRFYEPHFVNSEFP
jgi:hypothetical protein